MKKLFRVGSLSLETFESQASKCTTFDSDLDYVRVCLDFSKSKSKDKDGLTQEHISKTGTILKSIKVHPRLYAPNYGINKIILSVHKSTFKDITKFHSDFRAAFKGFCDQISFGNDPVTAEFAVWPNRLFELFNDDLVYTLGDKKISLKINKTLRCSRCSAVGHRISQCWTQSSEEAKIFQQHKLPFQHPK